MATVHYTLCAAILPYYVLQYKLSPLQKILDPSLHDTIHTMHGYTVVRTLYEHKQELIFVVMVLIWTAALIHSRESSQG